MKTLILFGFSVALFFGVSFITIVFAKEQSSLIELPQLFISLIYLVLGGLAYRLIGDNNLRRGLVLAPVAIFLVFVLYQFGRETVTKQQVLSAVESIQIKDYQHEPVFLKGTTKLIGLKVTLKLAVKENHILKVTPPIFFATNKPPSLGEVYSSLNDEVLRNVSITSNRLNGMTELVYYLYPSPIDKYRMASDVLEPGESEICLKVDTKLGFIGKPKHIDFSVYGPGTVINIGDRLLSFLNSNNSDFSHIENLEKATSKELLSKLSRC